VVVSTDAEVSSPATIGAERPATLLAAAADPTRLAILQTLTAGTTCVCELQSRLPIAANLLSYHLKVLREAGLIVGVRRGRWIDYSLADGALDRLHAALPTPAGG
jgi:ArsR family transcriptional regulator